MSINLDELRQPKVPIIGGRVRVTKSVFLRAAPVGTTGLLWRVSDGTYSEEHGHNIGQCTIWRDDGQGFGWCEEVEPIDEGAP